MRLISCNHEGAVGNFVAHVEVLQAAPGRSLADLPRRVSYRPRASPLEPKARNQEELAHKQKKTTAANDDGPLQKSIRGDKTPLELFIGGVRDWVVGLRWEMGYGIVHRHRAGTADFSCSGAVGFSRSPVQRVNGSFRTFTFSGTSYEGRSQ
jgi:hypothetical protein